MKVIIKATQEEFDLKRGELLEHLAGDKFTISKAGESSMTQEKEPFYESQAELLEHFDAKFDATLKLLKKEIGEIIEES